MDDTTKDWVDIILNAIQVIILVAGAIWAYIRFKIEDPLYPRIEFDIDCRFLGPQAGSYLTVFTVSARNKGNIQHTFAEIRLRVRGIKNGEPLTEFRKYPPMTNFPETIMKDINIVPPDLQYFFVRPGIDQDFNYVTQIAENIRFIIVRATFKYKKSNELHTAENVFEVRS